MKNIFVLPSDKPSRLIINHSGILTLGKEIYTILENKQNIYITNSEKPKVGDWAIEFQKGDSVGELHFINREYVLAPDIQKKVVICTDPDLIKNGVQSIDDEFLEWFVKNSSCEFVEVLWTIQAYKTEKEYKPIIPQEPKQETIEQYAKENALLELKNYAPTKERFKLSCKNSYLRGAKHQSEKMFSEEETLSFAEWMTSGVEFLDDIEKGRTYLYKHNRYTTKELLQIYKSQL